MGIIFKRVILDAVLFLNILKFVIRYARILFMILSIVTMMMI